MKTALFTNFSNEAFTGYWDGKPKTFKPGQTLYMPEYLAKHWAKHLANRELLKKGLERDTSPKVKVSKDGTESIENVNFMEMFNKAYTPDEDEAAAATPKNELDVQIEVMNRNRAEKLEAPTKSAMQNPNEQQVIGTPDDDEEGDDESAFPTATNP